MMPGVYNPSRRDLNRLYRLSIDRMPSPPDPHIAPKRPLALLTIESAALPTIVASPAVEWFAEPEAID